jgi:hypothetical protein
LLCNDPICPDCGAVPERRRCTRCGVVGLVLVCGHSESERLAQLDVSLVDFPKITCNRCELEQEDFSEVVVALLGTEAPGEAQTLFRAAMNEARRLRKPPGALINLGRSSLYDVGYYIWNEGAWRARAQMLLKEDRCEDDDN